MKEVDVKFIKDARKYVKAQQKQLNDHSLPPKIKMGIIVCDQSKNFERFLSIIDEQEAEILSLKTELNGIKEVSYNLLTGSTNKN